MSQKRNSVKHISPDPLTKDVPSNVPRKPQPKPRKLKPATNTQNEQISCPALLDSTSSAAGNIHIANTHQNVSKGNLPAPHIPLLLQQVPMHSEEPNHVDKNFQNNTQ